MTDVALCGWRVRSALALPDLLAWPDGETRSVDITVGFGPVPPLEAPLHDGPVVQIGAGGVCRFVLPAIGAFLLREGREITIAAADGASEADLRLVLLGSLFGLLCHQRGLLPLHASAVLIGGAAVAFVGPSGSGKSTLAAACARAGHPVLTDDVLVVDPSVAGHPLVRPMMPRLQLWRDTLEGMGGTTEGLKKTRVLLDKYALPTGPVMVTAPVPLAAVFHLEVATEPRLAGVERLAGLAAVAALRDGVHRAVIADRLGLATRIAADVLRLAPGLALHARLRRVLGFDGLDATVAVIEAQRGEAR